MHRYMTEPLARERQRALRRSAERYRLRVPLRRPRRPPPRPVWSAARVGVFDIAGPLVAYSLLRSAGQSPVLALALSGVFPGFGVAAGLVRHRRLDAIGILVLAGIAVGTILGLATGNARLVLVEGSVPTAIFGLACLGSLWSRRPLIFRFALEFIGAETPRGRYFSSRWRDAGFRRAFRVFTAVWGAAYLAEAAARVIIAETTTAATALAVSKVMPYAVAVVLVAWMIAYGQRAKHSGEGLAGTQAGPLPADPARRGNDNDEARRENTDAAVALDSR